MGKESVEEDTNEGGVKERRIRWTGELIIIVIMMRLLVEIITVIIKQKKKKKKRTKISTVLPNTWTGIA